MPEVRPSAHEQRQRRRLTLVLLIVTLFFGVQLAGAHYARSAVLQAEALHLLMDVVALLISLAAMRIALRHATQRFTFGFRRVEALAALINGLLVLGAALEIISDGVEALHGDERPEGSLMLMVASVAVVVNGLSAWLLHGVIGHHGHDHGHEHTSHAHHGHEHTSHAHHGHDHAHDHGHHGHDHGCTAVDAPEQAPQLHSVHDAAHGHLGHDLNMRGALLHLVGDALGAVAALIAAVIIHFGGPAYVDPVASFFVAAVLLIGSLRLLRDAGYVLLDGAPLRLSVDDVRRVLAELPNVASVDEVRLWCLGGGSDAVAVELCARDHDETLAQVANQRLRQELRLAYAVVQVNAAPPS